MTVQVKTQPEGGGYGCPLGNCLETLLDVATLTAHINTPHEAPEPEPEPEPEPAAKPAVDPDTAVVHPPAEMVNGRITCALCKRQYKTQKWYRKHNCHVSLPPETPDVPLEGGRRYDGALLIENKDGELIVRNVDPKMWAEWAVGTVNNGYGLKHRWAFDENTGWFHQWDGRRWDMVRHHGGLMLWENAIGQVPVNDPLRELLLKRDKQVRETLDTKIARKLGTIKVRHLLPLANGMFDLQTGILRPYDPTTDTHKEIIPTEYKADWSNEHCFDLLRQWFTPSGEMQMDEYNLWLFASAFGLTISGLSQSHTAIVFLWGGSGKGKGGTQILMEDTLGGMMQTLDPNAMMFNRGAVSNHDGGKAELIDKQQYVVFGDEARGRSTDQLLTATSNNVQTARYPGQLGAPLRGRTRAAYWLAATDPPQMPSDRGALRRLLVISLRAVPLLPKDKRAPTEDEKAALLTLGVRHAISVHQPGYEPPESEPGILEAFMQISDPLRAHIRDMNAEGLLLGASVAEIIGTYEAPDGGKPPTPNRVGAKVRSEALGLSEQWTLSECRSRLGAVGKQAKKRSYAHPVSLELTEALKEAWASRAADYETGKQAERILG